MIKMNYPAIMIDLETLGTRADAVIISIGAVKFDPNSDAHDNNGFYSSVSVDSNTEAGRHISEATLNWWMEQPLDARAVFQEPKNTLASALDNFVDWIGPGKYQMWSNGSDFDIPMIGHALVTHGKEIPWDFWDNRCFRTIKNLPMCKNAPKVLNPGKHNALSDALTQAKQLQQYFKIIYGRKAA